MECNCNNNSNGGVIPWVRGNRLPLVINVYELALEQEHVGESTLVTNNVTRVPLNIQEGDTVTVVMKSGFRSVEMPFTTEDNKVLVTDNGELPTGIYTVEVNIEREDGSRGRWQETRQVHIYENNSEAHLDSMFAIEADLFVYAKGSKGDKGDKGEKGDPGERGVSIVSFEPDRQTETSVIYTVTYSNGITQEVEIPKGPQGDAGLTGNGISSTILNSNYTLTITYTDGTTYTTPSIRGAQGAQGVSMVGFTQTGETATNTLYNIVMSDGRTQSVAIPKGTKGDRGVSIVSFEPLSQTSTSVVYTVTYSDGVTQEVEIPKSAPETGDYYNN